MRNFIAGLSGGSGAFAAAAVCAVLVAAGYWVQSGRNAATPPSGIAALPVVATPEAGTDAPAPKEAEVTEEAAATPAPQAPQPAAQTPPAFDEVRREADGMTVIAGRAMPGADVSVLKDGEVVAQGTADSAGKFATLAMIPPDGAGHVLSLLQSFEGKDVPSEGEIILAPIAAPQVAEVAPEVDRPVTDVEAESAEQETQTAQVEPTVTEQAETVEETMPQIEETQVAEAAAQDETEAQLTAPADPSTPEVQEVAEAPATADPEPVTASVEEAETPQVATAEAAEEPATPSVGGAPAAGEVAVAAVTEVAPVEPTVPATLPEQAPASDTPATVPPVVAAIEPTVQSDPAPQVAEANTPAPVTEPAAPAAPEPAPQSVAVLKSTAEGVELLNTPRPEAMTNVAIDTISYSDQGEVQLAGRAQADTSSVRVYLDNNSVVNLPVDAEGRWRGELPDVDEGVYTLRVDEVSTSGQVTSRVETPFKREDTEVLAAAAAEKPGAVKAITVQRGATLWAIARERYGDGELYVRVVEANSALIRNPDLIYPGQIFDLPD